MTIRHADPRTVEAYARELVSKKGPSPVLALAADPGYRGPEQVQVGDAVVHVRGCVSSLAVREFLLDLPDGAFGIVLTDRDELDLGDALRARFRRQRVEPLDPWTPVPGLFRGRQLEPGVRHDLPWLPELLLAQLPPDGYPASATEVVTRDHLLGAVSAAVLNLDVDQLGLSGLLDRMRSLNVRQAWAGLPADARASLTAWIGHRSGSACSAVLDLAASTATAHLQVAALGLMLDVLYGVDSASGSGGTRAGNATADVAGARLAWEHGYQLPRVAAADAREVGRAARQLLRDLARRAPAERDPIWRDTPESFELAGFPDGLRLSLAHPSGYDARLESFAQQIADSLAAPDAEASSVAVDNSLEALHAHDLAASDRVDETERADMAARLVRWLATPAAAPANLAEALRRQVADDGWADRALADVWSGSTNTAVARTYRDLCERVLQVRDEHDRLFAELLAAETARNVLAPGLLGVEDVMAQVIEPLGASHRLLVVVVDGMSAAVAAAIGDGIRERAWVEHVPATGTGHLGAAAGDAEAPGGGVRAAVLAALPTMTRYSRTSLLCGELRDGSQSDEKRVFAEITGGPLFHKDDLRAPAGSAVNPTVEAALAGDAAVVGVVLNTVDDHLAKHDPDGTRWSVDAIGHLASLLETARRYGRAVVITSDHGHVVERGSRSEPHDAADARWRPAADAQPTGDEVLLRGARVVPSGGAIIAPWVADLRYGRKAAGYHGGASAAEVTIPLLVFTPGDDDLATAGWKRAGDQSPTWWAPVTSGAAAEGQSVAASRAAARQSSAARTRRATPTPSDGDETHLTLFDVVEESPIAPADSAALDPHRLLADRVLASPVYARQAVEAGRMGMDNQMVGRVLQLLLAGGGRVPADRLAATVGTPVNRLPGPMSALRRMLNVEGYQVIAMDADRRTVVLDESLLRQQFGVGQG